MLRYEGLDHDGDGIFISLDTSNPGHTTPISSNVNIAFPIRGFFVESYSFNDPSEIAGPPWKTKEKYKEKDKDRKDGMKE